MLKRNYGRLGRHKRRIHNDESKLNTTSHKQARSRDDLRNTLSTLYTMIRKNAADRSIKS